MDICPFQPADEAAVIQLWQQCGLTRPWNDSQKDIARKLSQQPELFLVGRCDDEIVATVMAGFDGHRGWIYYLAVAPHQRRRSYGRQMLQAVEHLLIAKGCPKINLQICASNRETLSFYSNPRIDLFK